MIVLNKTDCQGAAIASIAMALLAPAHHANAQQSYPNKAIRFVVPFAPGGGTDFLARLIAQRMSESMGQPVIVDNRAGGGGIIGAEIAAKSPPDGYTIVMGSPGSLTINPLLSKTPYDPQRDFTPLSLATLSPFSIATHASVPVTNVKELIALAKAKPGTLNYSTSGNGSIAHFSGEHFKLLTGVNLMHVPYKGGGPASTALVAGEVQMTFENLPVVLPLARGGKIRILAVGSSKRTTLAPEIPTIAETVQGYESVTAFGVLGPAKLPAAIVKRLNEELVKALSDARISDQLSSRGMQVAANSPSEYAQFLAREHEKYLAIVKKTGITLD